MRKLLKSNAKGLKSYGGGSSQIMINYITD